MDYPAQLVTGGEAGDILSIPYTEGQVLLATMKDEVVLMPDQQIVY